MRFSTEFSVTSRTKKDDWFDGLLNADTPLYVDPFLVFEDKEKFWQDGYKDIVDFFDLCMSYVEEADGNKSSAAWGKSLRLMIFPEPKEFALGLAMGSPDGSGTATIFADRMVSALDLVRRQGGSSMHRIEGLALFCEGLGVDRISDVLCNILKARFITYTQRVCKRQGIQTELVTVRHMSWSRKTGRWMDGQVQLPKNSVTSGGVILTPSRFLKDIPRVTPDGFWQWAEVSAGTILRMDLNYDLSKSLTKAQRMREGREVAQRRTDLALAYVEKVAAAPHLPYDVEIDPDGRVGWFEVGEKAASAVESQSQPAEEANFCSWVEILMNDFKHAVEETDLWRALWNDEHTKPRNEKIVQAIAGAMWVSQCKAAEVDITKESNMGRGPVDFKFSKGWTKRALTEVKLIKSSQFFSGAEKQLPQYLRSERIDCGYYLAIGFTDADFEPDRHKKVLDTCAALSAQKHKIIKPIFVDARTANKISASKQKASN